MTTASFRTYTETKLVEHINDIFPELKITEYDIKNPKPEVIRSLFINFFTDVTNAENTFQSQFCGIANFEYAEVLQDVLPLCTLHVVLRDLMIKIGVDNFGIRDLIDPRPKRSRRCLSALLNFWLFCNKRYMLSTDYKAEAKKKQELRSQLEQEVDSVCRKINSIRANLVERQIMEKELNEKMEDTLPQLLQLSNQKNELHEEVKTIKNTLATEQLKFQNVTQQTLQHKAEIEKLSSQVVKDPEKFHANLLCKQEELNQKLEQQQEKSETLVKLNHTSDLQITSIKEPEKHLESLQEVEVERKKAKDIQKLRDAKQKQCQALNDSIEDLENCVKQKLQQQNVKHEKLTKLQLQWQKKKQAKQEEITELKEQISQLHQRRNEDDLALSQLDGECKQLTDEITVHENRKEEVKLFFWEQYARLLEEIDGYNNKLDTNFREELLK